MLSPTATVHLAARTASTVEFHLNLLSALHREGGYSTVPVFAGWAQTKAVELSRPGENPAAEALLSLQAAGLVYVIEERVRLTSIGAEVGRFLSEGR